MRLFFEKIKRYIIQIKLLLIRDGWKKAKWLKNKKIFGKIGEHCYYAPNILPPEPFLIQIHNNVVISANVRLITHSGYIVYLIMKKKPINIPAHTEKSK